MIRRLQHVAQVQTRLFFLKWLMRFYIVHGREEEEHKLLAKSLHLKEITNLGQNSYASSMPGVKM